MLGITLAKGRRFRRRSCWWSGGAIIPWLLHYVAHTGSRELFRLAVLAVALGVASGAAKLFGVSLALGAFFAGMIISEIAAFSHRAAEEVAAAADAFSVLFFVSVGMLFDPTSLFAQDLAYPGDAVRSSSSASRLAAFLVVLAFGYPIGTALIISASLAQIGEFSFILAELGVDLRLLPKQGRDLILAGAILSIVLNPLVFAVAERLKTLGRKARFWKGTAAAEIKAAAPATEAGAWRRPPLRQARTARRRMDAPPPTTLTGHTILIGYGRVGTLVGESLSEAGLPFLVIEDGGETITETACRRGRGGRGQRRQRTGLRRGEPCGCEAAGAGHSERLRGGTGHPAGAGRQSFHRGHRPAPISTRKSSI